MTLVHIFVIGKVKDTQISTKALKTVPERNTRIRLAKKDYIVMRKIHDLDHDQVEIYVEKL